MKKTLFQTLATAVVASLVLFALVGCNEVTSETPKADKPKVETPAPDPTPGGDPVVPPAATTTVTVDGSAADWATLDQAKVASSTAVNNADPTATATFTGIKAYANATTLFVLVTGTGIIGTSFDGNDSVSNLLIDADGSAATGWSAGHFWNGGTANVAFAGEYRVHGGYLHYSTDNADAWAPWPTATGNWAGSDPSNGLSFTSVTPAIAADQKGLEMSIPLSAFRVRPTTLHLGLFLTNGGTTQWQTLSYLPDNSVASGFLTVTVPSAQ